MSPTVFRDGEFRFFFFSREESRPHVPGIEPTNNAAERALRQSVIQRKISLGVQSANGAICRSRLLTVTTTLRQQGRDIWQFLELAWIAHHRGGPMPSLLTDP